MTGFDAPAQLRMAETLAGAGRLLDAIRVCREALQHAPGHPGFAVMLSNIVSRLGDADEATRLLEPITRQFPNNPDLWSGIATAANSCSFLDAQRVFELHAGYGLALERSRP